MSAFLVDWYFIFYYYVMECQVESIQYETTAICSVELQFRDFNISSRPLPSSIWCWCFHIRSYSMTDLFWPRFRFILGIPRVFYFLGYFSKMYKVVGLALYSDLSYPLRYLTYDGFFDFCFWESVILDIRSFLFSTYFSRCEGLIAPTTLIRIFLPNTRYFFSLPFGISH